MRCRTMGLMMFALAIGILFFGSNLNAQQPSSAIVPRLVNFSGSATDVHGKAISGVAGATFAIYKDQYEGAPLWIETQNVHPDADGNYTVQLGATKSEGLPVELFSTPEPRWLGVRINGGEEQPRVLLVSVPYALKAADAETLGGKPLSAFQLAPVAAHNSAGPREAQPAPTDLTEQSNEIVCSSGTACKAKFIPQFSSNGGSAKVTDSIMSQTGTTIGIAGSATVTGSLTAGSVAGSTGVTGTSSTGADAMLGQNVGGGIGVHGTASVAGGSPAVWGENFATSGGVADGVHGVAHSAGSSGVAGVNVGGVSGIGVGGFSTFNGIGVYGQASAGSGNSAAGVGVWGDTNNLNGYGVFGSAGGSALDGMHGISSNPSGSGVAGINFGGGDGIFGGQVPGGFAGYFNGNVNVVGNLSKGGGSFKIDHPLDPANKYLYHSFVESPDMMNIYNGNVTTDAQGNAIVVLPGWFEALNRDFRYQLTVIGQFAQAIVSREVANGQFGIKTDKPNIKVSWQITGIRQDKWANAHRIPVEEMKPEGERGFYLHPELFGAPLEQGIAARRHPAYTQRPPSESALRQDGAANH